MAAVARATAVSNSTNSLVVSCCDSELEIVVVAVRVHLRWSLWLYWYWPVYWCCISCTIAIVLYPSSTPTHASTPMLPYPNAPANPVVPTANKGVPCASCWFNLKRPAAVVASLWGSWQIQLPSSSDLHVRRQRILLKRIWWIVHRFANVDKNNI